ncbi:hypothetical protein ACIRP5_10095 [Streptomyces sp. NPDC101221]|uniref:hypothetical protein n=1 Tax=Streptomyces sp. NPDC101221 TaxID=3366132 RepID=UPI0037FF46A3
MINGNEFRPVNPFGVSVSAEHIVRRAFSPATRADALGWIEVAYGVDARRARQIAFALRNKVGRNG